MPKYEITVEATVHRTVTVEADTMEQAIIDANIEVIALTGAFRAESIEIKKEPDTTW